MKASLPLLISMLCVSAALAEPPPAPPAAAASSVVELVNKQLLLPLKKAESKRSRFSRAAPVPVQRRVRVVDPVALSDVRGRAFVRFAVDARRSWDEQGPWKEDSIVGCAYLNEREVFVRRGATYLPARSMLGHDEQERPGACRAAVEAHGSAREQQQNQSAHARSDLPVQQVRAMRQSKSAI